MPKGIYERTQKHLEQLKEQSKQARSCITKESYRKSSKTHTNKKLSKEHAKRISEGNKGHTVSKLTREKIGKANKGKKRSEETKKKLRRSHLGKKQSEETIQKRVKKLKGQKRTKETKEKIRQNTLKQFKDGVPEETKRKISRTLTGKYTGKNNPMFGKENKRGKHTEETKEKQRQAHLGNKCNWYIDGRSALSNPYSIDWTETLRKSIRQRDRYICQICGKEPAICVHHIDYNKKNNNPNNLITLCNKCHSKTNTNREYWTNYFNRNINIYE